MKTAALIIAAAALGLSGCATYPTTPPPYGSTTVRVSSKAPFGAYLTDGAGRALYILEGERMPGGTHRCTGPCLAVWPALHGAPVAGPGVNPAMLGSMSMHGGPHATYAGWPLYYYARDRAPGDTTGQHYTDAWGTWHLLSPSGQPIRPAGGY